MGVEMGISLGLRYPPYPPILCPFSSFAGATRGAAKPPAASFPLRAQPAPPKTQGVAKPPALLRLEKLRAKRARFSARSRSVLLVHVFVFFAFNTCVPSPSVLRCSCPVGLARWVFLEVSDVFFPSFPVPLSVLFLGSLLSSAIAPRGRL